MQSFCDILIAGGGPSGSSLAWALRDSGMNIMLMDKKGFPRDKVCAGWVTPPIMEALQLDLTDYSDKNVLQPILGFNVRMIGGKESRIHYGAEPVSYGIRRCEFDHYLLNRCGANIRMDSPIKTLERKRGYWVVNGEIKTPLLIGAGGHFCPVARQLGANPGLSEVTVAAQEIEFCMTDEQIQTCNVAAEIPELYFCKDMKGYGWIFRKGNFLNIGLGREDQHGLGRQVSDFCHYLQMLGKLPKGVEQKFKGHAYLLYGHARRRIVDDGVILVGDAAGLAFTQSGEGIRPAVESALFAAEAIEHARGNYDVVNLDRYVELITARFGVRPTRTIAEYLPEGIKLVLARGLLSMEFFVRNVVIDRWFLHRHQEAITIKG